MTAVLRSRKPRAEANGRRRHSGRSVSFMENTTNSGRLRSSTRRGSSSRGVVGRREDEGSGRVCWERQTRRGCTRGYLLSLRSPLIRSFFRRRRRPHRPRCPPRRPRLPSMAGYFSNHSQSRFLANSNSTSSATQTTVAPTPAPAPRPRVPSSKHFSTSLSTSSADEKSPNKDKPSASASRNASPVVHPLRHTYVRARPRRPPPSDS